MTTSRRSKPTNAASPASARLRTAGARITLPDEVAPGLATGLGGLGITLRDLAAHAGLARGGDVPALTETARDNAIAQHFGRGPWIAGGHLDRRRRHLGIMRDRQREIGDGADDRDEQREDDREDRPADEEMQYDRTHARDGHQPLTDFIVAREQENLAMQLGRLFTQDPARGE